VIDIENVLVTRIEMNDEAYQIVMEHKQEYSEKLIIIDAEFQMQSDDHINSSSNNHSSRAIY